jgi:SAM-dependent methyltransferase
MTSAARERIRGGGLRGGELLAWLAGHHPRERDAAFERMLGIDGSGQAATLGGELVGYNPSGVAPIVRAVIEAPIGAEDVFVDLGSGLGKVTALVHLLTGARACGVELQPALASEARARAADLALDLSYVAEDARLAELAQGTVFFLYLPFTGATLAAVIERLRLEAGKRPIVVCALGLDLGGVSWLRPRGIDSFWLEIYDSRCPGVPARPAGRSPLPAWAADIADERALDLGSGA